MKEGSWWQRLKSRWKVMLEEYGAVAIVTWFTLFGLTVLAFGIAIEAGSDPAEILKAIGMNPERAATIGETGKWGIAYGLTQLTKPLRIVIVLALTPIIARAWWKIRGIEPPLKREAPEAEEG